METQIKFLTEIVWQSFLIFIFIGSIASFVIGAWLLLKPASVFRANQYMNKWFSTRQAMRPLDMPHDTNRFIYRHHTVIGMLLFAGAAFILYSVLFRYDQQAVLASYAGTLNPVVLELWLESAVLLLGITSLFALLIALFLAVRPSLLRGLEARANRYYSMRPHTRFLETMRYAPDRSVSSFPRFYALAIMAGSLYVITSLWLFVL